MSLERSNLNTDKKKIAEITLKVLESISWKNTSVEMIKKKSKIKSFDKLVASKLDILKVINIYFDYKLSLSSKNLELSNNKDMVFEILMMRFDILQSHRKAVISIFNSFNKKPKNLIFFLPSVLDSIVLMCEYTQISTKGIIGQLKIKGILIVYALAFFTWIKDDSLSIEKTMTALDNYLDNAGKIINYLK